LRNGEGKMTSLTSRYVVDTHTFVWYLENHPRLGINARAEQ
jgi:hypothetical protein